MAGCVNDCESANLVVFLEYYVRLDWLELARALTPSTLCMPSTISIEIAPLQSRQLAAVTRLLANMLVVEAPEKL
jgi:hypothetical protein